MCVASLENNVVCPTYVGMNRLNPALLSQVYRMPHVCGDEPPLLQWFQQGYLYAPRMWG